MISKSAGQLNALSEAAIGAAIEVHRVLGPGFPETCYETALCAELIQRGIPHQNQVDLSILYKNIRVGTLRLDLLIDQQLVLELKAIDCLIKLHEVQLLCYLKATGLSLGLLINFNTQTLARGIKRIVNHFPEPLRPSALSAPLR
jgi:GxxExxY protein